MLPRSSPRRSPPRHNRLLYLRVPDDGSPAQAAWLRTIAPRALPPESRGLWHHPAFLKLWAASAVSDVGSQVSALALPCIAALTLGAPPWQMGLLSAAEPAPILFVGLFAGVWVDRLRRRPLMIAMDIGRAAILLTR